MSSCHDDCVEKKELKIWYEMIRLVLILLCTNKLIRLSPPPLSPSPSSSLIQYNLRLNVCVSIRFSAAVLSCAFFKFWIFIIFKILFTLFSPAELTLSFIADYGCHYALSYDKLIKQMPDAFQALEKTHIKNTKNY